MEVFYYELKEKAPSTVNLVKVLLKWLTMNF